MAAKPEWIIEDTRQKTGGAHKWKHDYWKEHGIGLTRSAMPVGDYMVAPDIVVDTKKGLVEIAGNLCALNSAERRRFANEEAKAQEMGTKLVFVVEQESISDKKDLIPLQIVLPNNQMVSGTQLMSAMEIHEHKYGSKFIFCEPSKAGQVVTEILSKSKLCN